VQTNDLINSDSEVETMKAESKSDDIITEIKNSKI